MSRLWDVGQPERQRNVYPTTVRFGGGSVCFALKGRGFSRPVMDAKFKDFSP